MRLLTIIACLETPLNLVLTLKIVLFAFKSLLSRVNEWMMGQHVGYLADRFQDWRMTFSLFAQQRLSGEILITASAGHTDCCSPNCSETLLELSFYLQRFFPWHLTVTFSSCAAQKNPNLQPIYLSISLSLSLSLHSLSYIFHLFLLLSHFPSFNKPSWCTIW